MPYSRALRSRLLLAAAVAFVCALFGPSGMRSGADGEGADREAGLAINEPDRYAWRLFAAISRPTGDGSRAVLWETWADQRDVYSDDPARSPRWAPRAPARAQAQAQAQEAPGTPETPGAAHPVKRLGPSLQHGSVALRPDQAPGQDEVRLNRSTFDYVLANRLWYTAGVVDFLGRQGPLKLPRDSVVVKARWRYICAEDKPRYHWHEGPFPVTDPAAGPPPDCAGAPPSEPVRILGLAALHVTSKVLPNWHWATFEQVDNPGRCDYLGCHDSWGQVPAHVPPRTDAQGLPLHDQLYRDTETLSPAAVALLEGAGLGPQWRFYRLKGSQVDFTSPAGEPSLVGNSVTEAGFVPTASCITCHSRAALSPAGSPLEMFQRQDPPLGYTGSPDPAWFRDTSAARGALYTQTDFLWQFPFIPRIVADTRAQGGG